MIWLMKKLRIDKITNFETYQRNSKAQATNISTV